MAGGARHSLLLMLYYPATLTPISPMPTSPMSISPMPISLTHVYLSHAYFTYAYFTYVCFNLVCFTLAYFTHAYLTISPLTISAMPISPMSVSPMSISPKWCSATAHWPLTSLAHPRKKEMQHNAISPSRRSKGYTVTSSLCASCYPPSTSLHYTIYNTTYCIQYYILYYIKYYIFELQQAYSHLCLGHPIPQWPDRRSKAEDSYASRKTTCGLDQTSNISVSNILHDRVVGCGKFSNTSQSYFVFSTATLRAHVQCWTERSLRRPKPPRLPCFSKIDSWIILQWFLVWMFRRF